MLKLFSDINNNAARSDSIEIDELSINEAGELFKLLVDNSSIKKIKIHHLTGDIQLFPAEALANLLQQNKFITDIEIQTEQKLHSDDAWIIKQALKDNTDIKVLKLNFAAYQFETNGYLERNKQLYFLAGIVIEDIINKYLTLEPKNRNPEIESILVDTKKQLLKNKSFHEIFNLLLSTYNVDSVSNDAIAETIYDAIDTLLSYENICLERDLLTPLHAAASADNPDIVTALLNMGAAIDALDGEGRTPIHYAINNLDLVKLLQKAGANLNIKDKDGLTVFMSAVLNDNEATASFLQQKSQNRDDPNKIKIQRRLYFAFGGEKIDDFLGSHSLSMKGITQAEAVETISTYLKRFLQKKPDDLLLPIIANNIATAALNTKLTSDELLEKIKNDKLLLGFTGSYDHVVGYCLLEKDNDYVLSIAERGLFMDSAPFANDKKRASIQSIPVPREHLSWVLNELKDSLFHSKENARKVLFEDIPAKLNEQWNYDLNLSQNPFKIGICAHGNLKALLLNELLKTYGQDEGFKLYKEFTLFLRTEILKDYKQYISENDPYVMICQMILDEKNETFSQRFNK